MSIEVYRIEAPDLIGALLGPELVGRYLDWLEQARGGLAEQDDIALCQRNQRTLGALQAYGAEALGSERPADLEALLADLVAVATFEGWDLPLAAVGKKDVDALAGLPAGWYGGAVPDRGPLLYRLDPDHLALHRSRGRGEDPQLRPDRFHG